MPWEQVMQMQSAQPVNYLPTSPIHPPDSPTSSIATVFNPQYVGHMPSIPASMASQVGDVSWVDFLVPIEGSEPYNQIVDGHHSPGEVQQGIRDSLRLLFDAGGVPAVYEYETFEEQVPFIPAIDLVNQLCCKYLSLWQPSQPVIHSPTWNGVDCPLALVSAMACIGSIFTQDIQHLQQVSYINERCISEINRLTEGPSQYQDTAYIAALCLHQTYLIGSCHDDVHEHADRVRSYMVEGLQAQNLLGPNQFDPGDILPPSCSTPEAVNTEWLAWVNYEQKVRVAWMVFEYDCSLSLLTGRPCAISLKHLPKVFPCEDALYNAPNAYTWAELAPRSAGLRGPEVLRVINLTINRTSLPHTASSWAKRLCAQIFERVLRGLLDSDQQNNTITSAREVNLHLKSSLSTIQVKLLWSINYLGKSASIYNQSPSVLQATGAGVDDYEMLSTFKLNHQSDDFGMCTRIMYMIRYITLAAISSPTDGRCADLLATQQRLILEFASVPQHARLYVYDAGQVLRTARESLPVTPVDYLRIFTAYLTILAFVKYGPPSRYDVSGVNPFHADVFPIFPTSSDRWIEHGGPATVGECGVFYPGCSTELIMRDASREFCSTGGWTLKQRFYCVLARFSALEVRRN